MPVLLLVLSEVTISPLRLQATVLLSIMTSMASSGCFVIVT